MSFRILLTTIKAGQRLTMAQGAIRQLPPDMRDYQIDSNRVRGSGYDLQRSRSALFRQTGGK